MSLEMFRVVEVNPNEASGGGGCLCSEDKNPDCKGPYVVFYAQDMASNISPHPVIGATCLKQAAKALDEDPLAGGEAGTIELPESEVEEITTPEDRFPVESDDVPTV